MSYLKINGSKKLSGAIATQAAKNSAMAILFASAMIKGKSILTDVPDIEDVHQAIKLLESIGVKAEWLGLGKVELDATQELKLKNMDENLAASFRAPLLLLGALANRADNYKLYKAGGCHLGERTVRPHLYALEKFGVKVSSGESFYKVENELPLKAAEVVMYESGDTATENAIMAAVLAEGTSTIKMASANYMVQDLCYFLQEAGARIQGIGTTTLIIVGVKKLKPVINYSIMPDPIVAMTLISTAIVTGSRLTINNCPLEFLELELEKLSVMGQKFNLINKRQSNNGKFVLADIEIVPSKLKALPDKIYGRPFPGLNIDNLPLFIPILTQAEGRTLVHDWAYEDRVMYSLELRKLGAKISLIDIHRVWVEGPTEFKANEIICPPALRPAVNVLLCMLAAKGKSILRNTHAIERGYENLYDLLNSVGADIKVVKE